MEEAKNVITGSLEAIRISPDRLQLLEDGWFRDKYLTAYYGRNFDWSPESLEKYMPWKKVKIMPPKPDFSQAVLR